MRPPCASQRTAAACCSAPAASPLSLAARAPRAPCPNSAATASADRSWQAARSAMPFSSANLGLAPARYTSVASIGALTCAASCAVHWPSAAAPRQRSLPTHADQPGPSGRTHASSSSPNSCYRFSSWPAPTRGAATHTTAAAAAPSSPPGPTTASGQLQQQQHLLQQEPQQRPVALVLGIESSCDDTGVAVVASDGRVLGEAIASQAEVHAPWGESRLGPTREGEFTPLLFVSFIMA